MLLYTFIYIGLLIVCFTQSFYPIFMLVAMLIRESRWFYPFFHQVDRDSRRHGGELVAQVLKGHGVERIFTSPDEQLSPILVASQDLNIEVDDARHEAKAVSAADAWSRSSRIPGVAVLTARDGLANTLTAIKNAQVAESPVVLIVVSAATMLKGDGSTQDTDQISLLKSKFKRSFSVDCVRDIVPTLREAFRESQMGVPGPVFVELHADTLHPYHVIAKRLASTSSYKLNQIFADAWRDRDLDPLPLLARPPY